MASVFRILPALAMIVTATAACAQVDNDELNAIDDMPHVTVVGSASAEVVPDVAVIRLGVKTERAKPAEASAETARLARAIVDAAKAGGVDAKDIRTEAVTLRQVFDDVQDANGRYTGRRPRGFEAGHAISVRVRALDHAGALAQSLVEAGASEFDGIAFSLENPGPVEDKLVAEAVRDAGRKAGLAAAAAGAKLGRVLLIERPQAADGAPAMLRRMAAPALAPAIPVEGGTQTLRSEMEVTWSLEP